jgi:dihydrodipicolinate reductase
MGYLFKPYKITILESHQSNKKTIPGTAVHFADSLGVAPKNIISIRDKNTQITEVGIPNDFLDAHAFHKVSISNGDENIVIETTVLGHRSYSQGVAELVKAILNKNLESRKYSILEMMELGLIG